MIVTMEDYEVSCYLAVGAERRRRAIARKSRDKFPTGGTFWDKDIEGAGAEMAVAKHFNVYWNASVDTFKRGGDVGKRGQVRHSLHPKRDLNLVIREYDRPEDLFVFVRGQEGRFELCGWIWGDDAMVDKYAKHFKGEGPRWWVPQHELRPMDEMRREYLL